MAEFHQTFILGACYYCIFGAFQISGRIETTRGPWATTLTWMYSCEGYIQPKYCKCCMQENLAFHFPWPAIKISDVDKIHMNHRGLL